MRKSLCVLTIIAAALLALGQALPAQAAASSITFNIDMAGSYDDMKDPYWGKMVSPDGSCQFWSNVSAQQTSWTWNNDGSNVNKFALELNYSLMQGGQWTASTVIGIVIADPNAMPDGSNTVTVVLQKCKLGQGNYVLAVKEVQGQGAERGQCSATPMCNDFQ